MFRQVDQMKKFMSFAVIFILIIVALNGCVSSKEQVQTEKTNETQKENVQASQNTSSLLIYAAVDKSVDKFLKE